MTNKTAPLVIVAFFVSGSGPAQGGPITFLTALPVAQSQAVVRGQYFLIRARDDPTPAERDLTDTDIQQAIRKAGFTPGKIEWRSGGSTVKEKTTGGQSSEETTATFAIEGVLPRSTGNRGRRRSDTTQTVYATDPAGDRVFVLTATTGS